MLYAGGGAENKREQTVGVPELPSYHASCIASPDYAYAETFNRLLRDIKTKELVRIRDFCFFLHSFIRRATIRCRILRLIPERFRYIFWLIYRFCHIEKSSEAQFRSNRHSGRCRAAEFDKGFYIFRRKAARPPDFRPC